MSGSPPIFALSNITTVSHTQTGATVSSIVANRVSSSFWAFPIESRCPWTWLPFSAAQKVFKSLPAHFPKFYILHTFVHFLYISLENASFVFLSFKTKDTTEKFETHQRVFSNYALSNRFTFSQNQTGSTSPLVACARN